MNFKILTGNEFYEKLNKLRLVKQMNWENYYIDDVTREKWIEEYPESSSHGGGYPQLRLIEKFPWEE